MIDNDYTDDDDDDVSIKDVVVRPSALPATKDAFLLHRKLKGAMSINDQVEENALNLVNGGGPDCDRYLKLLNAVYKEDAVEGSLRADNYAAAIMLRQIARDNGVTAIGEAPLEKVVQAQGVFLRRYGLSRTERRKSVEQIEQQQ
jgi:hypothetical protein